MFSAAIFDMDGLLIDSERPIMTAWIAAARALDIELSHASYLQCVGLSSTESEAVMSGLLGGPDIYRVAVEKVRAALMLERTDGAPLFPIKSGAAELIDAMHARGIRCAVASSSTRRQIEACLGSLGLLHRFEAIAGGDEVVRAKPDPALYQLAASRLDVDPADCIAFEDSENGARSALAAGLRVVVVPDLKHPPDAIIARAFHVLDSLHDAVPHLPTWFPPASQKAAV